MGQEDWLYIGSNMSYKGSHNLVPIFRQKANGHKKSQPKPNSTFCIQTPLKAQFKSHAVKVMQT